MFNVRVVDSLFLYH